MARTSRGGQLETRTARLKLAPRGKPYYANTAKQGLHLGYRRINNRNGTWSARVYQGLSTERYALKSFGQADDYAEADGDEHRAPVALAVAGADEVIGAQQHHDGRRIDDGEHVRQVANGDHGGVRTRGWRS